VAGRQDKFEAVDILRKFDIPCAPVLTMKELANDPSLRASGTIVEVDHKERGKYLTVAARSSSRTSSRDSSARPCLENTPMRCSPGWATTSRINSLRSAQAV